MNTKNILKFCSCAMALGLLLAGIGYFSGANLQNKITLGSSGIQVTGSEPHTIDRQNLNAFESINLSVLNGNIIFIASDHYGADISYYEKENHYNITEENGTLTINDTNIQSEDRAVSINFNLTPFSANYSTGQSGQADMIKIYVPKAAEFKNITVKSQCGNFTAADFTSENTDIQLSTGGLILSNADCGKTSINLKCGECHLDTIKTDILTCYSDMGNMAVYNLNSNETTVKCKCGETNLTGELKGNTIVENICGDINVETSIPRDQYAYQISSLGEITVNGRVFKRKAIQSGNAENKLSVTNKDGEIFVDFLGKY